MQRCAPVSIVGVYHLAPTRLIGGFAGVDVFLVIGVITCFDGSHLAATCALALAPYFLPPIERLLQRSSAQ